MVHRRRLLRQSIFAIAVVALPLGVAWTVACSGGADTGVSCLRLTCPVGHEVDQVACTCRPTGATSNDGSTSCTTSCEAGTKQNPTTCACEPQATQCAAPCTQGQACNPTSGACEASPGGGSIRTDLVNKEMSIGLHDNSFGPPQGIREAHLDFNWSSGKVNSIVAVAVPPGSITIDGANTSADEWKGVPVATLAGVARASTLMPLARRANDAGAANITTEDQGVTEVKIAAAYDGSSIFFHIEWSDATQNDARGRWIYNGTKWVRDTAQTQPLAADNLATTRAATGGDDMVQLLFNINIPSFFGDNGGFGAGCAGLCHLEGKAGARVASATTTDAGVTFYSGSGMMYTNGPGQKVDVWDWKASRSNPLRIFDDQVIDDTSRHGDGNQNDDFPYTGGTCTRKNTDGLRFPAADSTATQLHFSNEYFDDVTAGCPSLGPSRVPSPYASGVKSMFEDNSPFIGKAGATRSKLLDGTVTPSVNDTIPGFVHRTTASTPACLRCQNEAEGHWQGGKWIVEMRRSLVAPDADDVDFTTTQK